ncbi:alpha/beta fold hydrolase [Aspergillus saccharolyticus JOP 1030-1]|uniref:AB hydrolase-1 domain-containing protein n=1 Tax=Aspergillus saccharolyticus JOP 1030-1 TaxID=1450539 RepID=A0A318ZM18_9EURO|nr:hypothetical protein BP01DRAFT_371574 [Aspergillus saccharolyticus JOP 1030-1]PYH48651.1 hypothetical protein BP01DRAFT_371574 [Aspergillus saccharolyticus JOP 1030-1]
MTNTRNLSEFTAQKRFHQRFVLPATEDHGPIAVTYADVGPRQNEDGSPVPVILAVPGMAGSRLWLYHQDHLANVIGVRLLSIDRPGIGGSTPVPVEKRVSIWLETVTALLDHLSVPHVVPISHSAGTIYLLNLLACRRDLLWPRKPIAMLLAPWVEPKHSDVLSMQMARMLPTGMLNQWNKLIQFSLTKIAPTFGASAGILANLSSSLPSMGKGPISEGTDPCLATYGMSAEAVETLEKITLEYMFKENSTGINDEAIVCLKKGTSGLWGACEDLPAYVRHMVQAGRDRTQQHPQEEPLRLKGVFAEKDGMIGYKGQQYFEQCFTRDNLGGVVSFESVVIPGTEHDSVWSTRTGVLEKLLWEIKKMAQ